MGKQEEFDLGSTFHKSPTKYVSGPYTAHHFPGDKHATIYHKSDPSDPVDTIPTMVEGGPQASLNKWHAQLRKGFR